VSGDSLVPDLPAVWSRTISACSSAPSSVQPAGFGPAHTAPEAAFGRVRNRAVSWPLACLACAGRHDRSAHIPDLGSLASRGRQMVHWSPRSAAGHARREGLCRLRRAREPRLARPVTGRRRVMSTTMPVSNGSPHLADQGRRRFVSLVFLTVFLVPGGLVSKSVSGTGR
jgi:hypothetical protein